MAKTVSFSTHSRISKMHFLDDEKAHAAYNRISQALFNPHSDTAITVGLQDGGEITIRLDAVEDCAITQILNDVDIEMYNLLAQQDKRRLDVLKAYGLMDTGDK